MTPYAVSARKLADNRVPYILLLPVANIVASGAHKSCQTTLALERRAMALIDLVNTPLCMKEQTYQTTKVYLTSCCGLTHNSARRYRARRSCARILSGSGGSCKWGAEILPRSKTVTEVAVTHHAEM